MSPGVLNGFGRIHTKVITRLTHILVQSIQELLSHITPNQWLFYVNLKVALEEQTGNIKGRSRILKKTVRYLV